MSFLIDIAKASVWAANALVGTATGGKVGIPEPPAKVVLVPPLFERDLRLRSRMAHSSYDHLFAKPALRWLLTDYISPGGRAWLHFRPAEDPRVSVSADLSGSPDQSSRDSTGTVTLRYQPQPEDPLNFFDVRAAASGGGGARVRGCAFHQASGLGAWAVAPLLMAKEAHALGSSPELGLRYSSPAVTAGLVLGPSAGSVKQFWLAGRSGSFTVGVQMEPHSTLNLNDLQSFSLPQLWDDCRNSLSYCLAYSPAGESPYATAAGRGSFTAAVEVRQQRQLLVSFLYHLAVQRNVKNPFETSDVVGITNYIDIGLQVATDVASHSPSAIPGSPLLPAGTAALGLAWQVNKNVMVKGRVSTDSAGAALAIKSWWNPSAVFAVCCTYPFGGYSSVPKLGFTFGCENFGNIRYERSKDKRLQGSSIVQRHVALPADVRMHEGKGISVPIEDLDDPHILGQMPRRGDQYM